MLKKIITNKFFQSILTLSTGTILGQIISLVFSPLMTRLYSSSDIGMYTIIITAVGMFGGILAGRYDLAIVTEEDEANSDALIKFCALLVSLLSLVISIFYTLYYYTTGNLSFSIIYFFILVLVLLFLQGLTLILTSYNNRMNLYSTISKSSIAQSIGREGSMVFFGYVFSNSFGLTFSQILGRIFNLLVQSKSIFNRRKNIMKVGKENIVFVARKYKDQPIFSAPALFANSFSYSSINLFIDQLFGASTLGFYSISYRILGIPLTLVSGNVSKVYFREASIEYNKHGSYRRRFIQTSLFLGIIAIVMVLTLIFFSPKVFSIVFGSSWVVSGEYVQILAPMYGFRLVVSSLSTGTIISRKQNYELKMQSAFVFASFFIFLIVNHYNYPIKVYLYLISIVYSVIYFGYYVILYKMSGQSNVFAEKTE